MCQFTGAHLHLDLLILQLMMPGMMWHICQLTVPLDQLSELAYLPIHSTPPAVHFFDLATRIVCPFGVRVVLI
jgi:hypothetical protein